MHLPRRRHLITRVSSKGQVVLPVPVRRALGIAAGDVLSIEIVESHEEQALVLKRPAMNDIEARLERGYDRVLSGNSIEVPTGRI